ncbi:MAG: 1-deoxy-D-xylulose-5-phosphate reductoisomerase [Tepidisphaeraceae bacterium]
MSKRVAVLGSTGSIGCNALEVIAHLGPPYRAVALSAHRQTDKLLAQVERHRPAAVAVSNGATDELVAKIERSGAKVYTGEAGLVEMVRRDDIDIVLSAIVGAAGLPAAFVTVQSGKTLALANKESLVVAGSLLIREARKHNAPILPVDSEHSAIFQAMLAGRRSEVRRVILTASGGPFRNASREEMNRATVDDALKHPTWRMGNKITIDSATMFNKGLELIEACWLFDLEPEQLEVVIHPESIVHSMVEFVDGSTIAQLSPPDMRTPIQYALTSPRRAAGIGRRLDLTQSFQLTFEPPDFDRFPALKIAYDIARRGGNSGAVMNAANESAVAAFTSGRVAFGEISSLVRSTIDAIPLQNSPTLDDLLQADHEARATVKRLIDNN